MTGQTHDTLRAVVDRLIENDLAFGRPLTNEYPSRAMLRSDVKKLASMLFGDAIFDDAHYRKVFGR